MQLAQPLTLDLDPWQIEGRDFLAMSKSAFLADEMGVGKTAQAITAFEAIGANRVLIICAAIGRIEWARRIAEWGKHGRKIQVIDTSATLPDPSADAIIIGRELTPKPKLLKALLAQDFDVCVIDECHAFKEREAKRTKAVYGPLCSSGGIVSRARRIWLLSGTPAPNNHSELWTHLRRISPERIETSRGVPMGWYSFVGAFCTVRSTDYGLKITGSKNAGDLRTRMKGWMLRRMAKDVQDLPALTSATYVLPQDRTAKAALRELAKDPDYKALEAVVRGLAPAKRFDAADQELVLARLRKVTGKLKMPAVATLVSDELDAGQYRKIVLFAHHTDVLTGLRDRLQKFNPVLIMGGVSNKARQEGIDRFDTDPSCRVCLGQITAAGTSITLTAADQFGFVEISYVPGDNAQAWKRVHRRGQKRPVHGRFFTLAGSLDEDVTETERRKAADLMEMFG